MDCLFDYIGLRYCRSENVPKSGYYINDMAGVSLNSIDSLANTELDNFLGIWNKVQRRTIMQYKTLLTQRFNRIVRTHNKAYINSIGYYNGNEELLVTQNKLVGVRYKQNLGHYKKIKFYSLEIYSQNIVSDAKFYIYNLVTGLKIYEYTKDLSIGFNQLAFDFEYFEGVEQCTDLFICYDAEIIQSKNTNLTNFYNDNCDFTIINSSAICDNNLIPNNQNIESGDGTYGLVIKFKIDCSMDAFICSIKEYLTDSLSLLLLSELYKEQLHTERLNLFSIEFSHEEIQKLIENAKKDCEYSLDAVFDNLCTPCDSCFENNARVHSLWRKP